MLLVAACGACGSRGATQESPPSTPPATPTEPEKLGVVFERLLVDWEAPAPLFGPDGSVTVGARRWNADGTGVARHVFARDGQRRPVALAGTPDAPRMIALGWSGLEDVPPAPPAEDRAWLVTGRLDTETSSATPLHHEFLGENNVELSPDGASLVTIERSDVVVRAAATGIEHARHPLGAVENISFPDAQHVCWLDDVHVAWIGHDKTTPVLRVAAAHGAIATTPLAGPATIVACDPAGGAAAIESAGSIAVLDLEDATVTAVHAIDPDGDHRVAIGARGHRVAIATASGVTLYRRDAAGIASAYALARPAAPDDDDRRPAKLAFSRDGHRLAITDATLVVVGDISNVPAPLAVPTIAFDLPHGFVDSPIDTAWRYAQLPVPSGAAPLPALLVNAQSDDHPIAHVIGLAVDRAELPRIPPDTASDAEMKAFAKRTMQRWFEAWQFADLDDTNPDADYTITVGRTNGMRWFETREIHRDGCEPYDGYTRVVIDTHLAYIVRAITVPGGSIDGWLAPFLDLPFDARVQTARRKGPRTGPC